MNLDDTEILPYGALPRYDYPPGTTFVHVDYDGSLLSYVQPGRQNYFTCPLVSVSVITRADIPRLKREIRARLPGADHMRVILAGPRGIGIYAALLPV
jgi:hypothetical protein